MINQTNQLNLSGRSINLDKREFRGDFFLKRVQNRILNFQACNKLVVLVYSEIPGT